MSHVIWVCFFFFQAEDGIRDYKVTGVQTCALPISGRPDALGGQQDIDAAARAEVEDRLPWVQLRQGGGIATAERREHGALGQPRGLAGVVQLRSDGIAAAAAALLAFEHPQRRLAVLLPYSFLDVWAAHQKLLVIGSRPSGNSRRARRASRHP